MPGRVEEPAFVFQRTSDSPRELGAPTFSHSLRKGWDSTTLTPRAFRSEPVYKPPDGRMRRSKVRRRGTKDGSPRARGPRGHRAPGERSWLVGVRLGLSPWGGGASLGKWAHHALIDPALKSCRRAPSISASLAEMDGKICHCLRAGAIVARFSGRKNTSSRFLTFETCRRTSTRRHLWTGPPIMMQRGGNQC
jgi:hypothetical protein